jgi:hypothetical protein
MTADSSMNAREDVIFALGALVVNAASAEEGLRDAIYPIADEHDAVNVLTAGLPFRALVDKFGALCKQTGRARLPIEDVHAFCNALNGLYDERNVAIHSAYNLRVEDLPHRSYKRSAKPKTGFSLNVKAITASDIRDLAERFRQASQKVWEFVP